MGTMPTTQSMRKTWSWLESWAESSLLEGTIATSTSLSLKYKFAGIGMTENSHHKTCIALTEQSRIATQKELHSSSTHKRYYKRYRLKPSVKPSLFACPFEAAPVCPHIFMSMPSKFGKNEEDFDTSLHNISSSL